MAGVSGLPGSGAAGACALPFCLRSLGCCSAWCCAGGFGLGSSGSRSSSRLLSRVLAMTILLATVACITPFQTSCPSTITGLSPESTVSYHIAYLHSSVLNRRGLIEIHGCLAPICF